MSCIEKIKGHPYGQWTDRQLGQAQRSTQYSSQYTTVSCEGHAGLLSVCLGEWLLMSADNTCDKGFLIDWQTAVTVSEWPDHTAASHYSASHTQTILWALYVQPIMTTDQQTDSQWLCTGWQAAAAGLAEAHPPLHCGLVVRYNMICCTVPLNVQHVHSKLKQCSLGASD